MRPRSAAADADAAAAAAAVVGRRQTCTGYSL